MRASFKACMSFMQTSKRACIGASFCRHMAIKVFEYWIRLSPLHYFQRAVTTRHCILLFLNIFFLYVEIMTYYKCSTFLFHEILWYTLCVARHFALCISLIGYMTLYVDLSCRRRCDVIPEVALTLKRPCFDVMLELWTWQLTSSWNNYYEPYM